MSTIQNVSIKYFDPATGKGVLNLFTIQNVPIKLSSSLMLLSLKKYLQYKMFLLNNFLYTPFSITPQFTIQNVPIKLENIVQAIARDCHLQYKMFLLNYSNCNNQYHFNKFTIQNVPIKYRNANTLVVRKVYIYNTKCSY